MVIFKLILKQSCLPSFKYYHKRDFKYYHKRDDSLVQSEAATPDLLVQNLINSV